MTNKEIVNLLYSQWAAQNLSPKVQYKQLRERYEYLASRPQIIINNMLSEAATTDVFAIPVEFNGNTAVGYINQEKLQAVIDSLDDGELTSIPVYDGHGQYAGFVTLTKEEILSKVEDEVTTVKAQTDVLLSAINVNVRGETFDSLRLSLLSQMQTATDVLYSQFMRVANSILERCQTVEQFIGAWLDAITPDVISVDEPGFAYPELAFSIGGIGLSSWFPELVTDVAQACASAVANVVAAAFGAAEFAYNNGVELFAKVFREVQFRVNASWYGSTFRETNRYKNAGSNATGYQFSPPFEETASADERALCLASISDSLDMTISNIVKQYNDPLMTQELCNAMLAAGCQPKVTYAVPTIGATWYLTIADPSSFEHGIYGNIGYTPCLYNGDSAEEYYHILTGARHYDWQSLYDFMSTISATTPAPFIREIGQYDLAGAFNKEVMSSLQSSGWLILPGLALLTGDYDKMSQYGSGSDEWVVWTRAWTPSLPSGYNDRKWIGRSEALDFAVKVRTDYITLALAEAQSLLTQYFTNLNLGTGMDVIHFPVSEPLSGAYAAISDAELSEMFRSQFTKTILTAVAIAATAALVAGEIALMKKYRIAHRDYELAFFDPSTSEETLNKLRAKMNFLRIVSGAPLVSAISSVFTTPAREQKQTSIEAVEDSESFNDLATSTTDINALVAEVIRLIRGQ